MAVAATSAYMASTDLPVPSLMSLIAVAIELGVGLAIAIGFYTRRLALLLGIYTLIAAVIGHPYWHMSGELQYESMNNFYKNIRTEERRVGKECVSKGRYRGLT